MKRKQAYKSGYVFQSQFVIVFTSQGNETYAYAYKLYISS